MSHKPFIQVGTPGSGPLFLRSPFVGARTFKVRPVSDGVSLSLRRGRPFPGTTKSGHPEREREIFRGHARETPWLKRTKMARPVPPKVGRLQASMSGHGDQWSVTATLQSWQSCMDRMNCMGLLLKGQECLGNSQPMRSLWVVEAGGCNMRTFPANMHWDQT